MSIIETASALAAGSEVLELLGAAFACIAAAVYWLVGGRDGDTL